MKKYFLFSCIAFFAFKILPDGWTKIEKTKINGEKFEVYFFDYMSKLDKLQPDYMQYKGRQFTNVLKKVQFQFPAYVAKKQMAKEDSVVYYLLRPNEAKADRPNFFDLEIIKANKTFPIESLEDKTNYKDQILKTIDATGCRGSLVSEYNKLIQNSPNKDKIIGNGIQITDSIYTRVIPYSEFKNSFYKLIEANLDVTTMRQ